MASGDGGIDFARISSKGDIEEELKHMAESGRVRKDDLHYINSVKLMKFFESPLGIEMKAAKDRGALYREQPFVIGVPMREVIPDSDRDSEVLVQGIIDGFYETDEGIVLMDYKTDHLDEGQEQVLAERYRTQMELYARALSGITGRPVIKMVLYSFSLDKEIELQCGNEE